MTAIILHALVFLISEETMKKVLVFVAVLFAAVSVFAEISGDVQDQQACEYARKADSKEVWQKYRKNFPEGSCIFEAEAEIKKLKSSAKRNFYIMPKIGFGADFSGAPGLWDLYYLYEEQEMKNQFGLSIGLDFDWVIYKSKNIDGKLLLGFGVGFQYWMPTSTYDGTDYRDYFYDEDDEDDYHYDIKMKMHYMRLPLMVNLSYEFKTKSDLITEIGSKLSLGFNNNFFAFDISEEKRYNDDQLATYKCSFAWGLGLNAIFKEKFVIIATIGGDAGSGHAKNAIFFPNSKSKKGLYSHHEFITMELGFRL